jgi:uncharacterized protein (TIGR01777 family)
MRVVIPGGSGQVGTVLARAFRDDGYDVVVLSRKPPPRGPWRVVAWDGRAVGPWAREIDGADVVVNLAGRSVNCRYTPRNMADILRSRVDSTRAVGEAIARAQRPPRVWLQASTATIYAHRFDGANDEESGIIGGQEPGVPGYWAFSIRVAREWEAALAAANTPRTRRVAMRSAMTMSPDRGGIFDTLIALARFGLGGRAGRGRQYVSWVHEHDFVNAVRWLIANETFDGIVNIAAPNPLPQAEFTRVLRQAAGMPIGLPAMKWMLEIGAVFLRTDTELILKSRRVVPGRLLDAGFQFRYPVWADAARELATRWRAERPGRTR